MSNREKRENELPALVDVSKKAGKAIIDFDMIQEGDRILVGVSGGKDSLSLMHVLRHRQKISPVNFEFTAVHIDFEFPNFNPQDLKDYLNAQKFDCLMEKVDILKGQTGEEINCFWCSNNRRKAIFQLADRGGFTKVAFGHHMDDIAETIILNQFYRGEIGAMKPKLEIFDGKIAIIRPLAYVREQEMEELAKALGITRIGQPGCPNNRTSHRMLIKKMLRDFEQHNPMIVTNIFRSLQRIQKDYLIETVKQCPDAILKRL